MKLLCSLASAVIAASTMVGASASFANVKTCVHGHSGVFETPDRVSGNVHFKGWGVDFSSSGVYNWIHYAVPTALGNRYGKSVQLQFWMGSSDVSVTAVHVYNGPVKVRSFAVNWSGTSRWQTKTLDLGNVDVNLGLGVSVQVGSGVESMSHRVVISNVCGWFSSRSTSSEPAPVPPVAVPRIAPPPIEN